MTREVPETHFSGFSTHFSDTQPPGKYTWSSAILELTLYNLPQVLMPLLVLLACPRHQDHVRHVVAAMMSINLNCLARSTSSCQSLVIASQPRGSFRGWGLSPVLLKLRVHLEGRCHLLLMMHMQIVSATAHRTWLWCKKY